MEKPLTLYDLTLYVNDQVDDTVREEYDALSDDTKRTLPSPRDYWLVGAGTRGWIREKYQVTVGSQRACKSLL